MGRFGDIWKQFGSLQRQVASSLPPAPASSTPSAPAGASTAQRGLNTTWAGDTDGVPDPGEIVWVWVPYEDDPTQGKDRPVLLIARRDSQRLVGLPLTSKDHDRDAAQEARAGRFWMDIGTGPWDRERRPSEVRLNRLIEVNAADVRREGAILDRQRYDQVIAAARHYLQ
jgi:hypothetical protein